MRRVWLMLVIGVVSAAVLSCKKETPAQPSNETGNGAVTFTEDFSGGFSEWTLFGSPSPQIVDVHGKTAVFDNNGDGWCASGAVTAQHTFDITRGAEISADMYIEVTDYAGCWVHDVLGFTNGEIAQGGDCAGENYKAWWLLNFAMVGDACWANDPAARRHSWIWVSGEQPQQGYNADNDVNGWHNVRLVFHPDTTVDVYLDGNQVLGRRAIPVPAGFDLSNLKLYLGNRSSGYGGKAYMDNVRVVTY